jgi:recombination protein RecA
MMRKVTQTLGKERICMVFTNQLKTKIGVMYGDPMTTPGGKAVPYHASVRVRLTRGSTEKDGDEEIMGVNTSAKVFKNRMGPPLRKCKFFISFENGIEDEASWFNSLHERGVIEKKGGWCYISEYETEFKFRESQWVQTLKNDKKFYEWILNKLEQIMVVKYGQKPHDMEVDPESVMEVEQTVEDLVDPK